MASERDELVRHATTSRRRRDPNDRGNGSGQHVPERPNSWLTRESILFSLYLLMVIAGATRHEPWRDEVQAYAISFHSHSPADLIQWLRSEGHPALWPILLKPFTALPGQLGLKLAGLITGAGTAWLLFRGLPLPLWIRSGILLSYYWLFEYVVVSRNYAIGYLLTTAAFLLWQRKRSPPLAALLFGLAANTHVLIALTNIPLLIYCFRESSRACSRAHSRRALAHAVAIVVALYGTSAVTIASTRAPVIGLKRLSTSIHRPASKPVGSGENSPELPKKKTRENNPSQAPRTQEGANAQPQTSGPLAGLRDIKSRSIELLWTALPFCGAGVFLAILLTSPSVALIYTLPSTALAAAFSLSIHSFSVWHKGIYLMIMVYSLALCQESQRKANPNHWLCQGWRSAITTSSRAGKLGTISLSLLLGFQVILGMNYWFEDLRYPFSGAQAAGSFLRDHGMVAEQIFIYDRALAQSGINMAFNMAPMHTLPSGGPMLRPFQRAARKQRARPQERARKFCSEAASTAARTNQKTAIATIIRNNQRAGIPLCHNSKLYFFEGIREKVQLEIIAPPPISQQNGSRPEHR